MELSFLQPLMALLFLAVPLVWFLPSRPRVMHGVIRTVVLALAILALMQPVLVRSAAEQHHAIVLDQSASLLPTERDGGVAVAGDLLDRLGTGQSATVVQIGGGEQVSFDADIHWMRSGSGDSSATDESLLGDGASPLGDGASPIGDALELAAQSIPAGLSGSIMLITDGRSTDRHWGRSFGQIQDRGIPVHTVQLRPHDDPFLVNPQSTTARPGESVRVTMDVVGVGSGFEVVVADADNVLGRAGPFDCESRCPVAIEFEAAQTGFIDVTAELRAPDDVDPANNRLDGVVAIQDPLRVLYVGERQLGAVDQLGSLLGIGFDLTGSTPDSLGRDFPYADYDVVMLDDAPARLLADESQRRLTTAVQDEGVGLLASGGGAAFADGGYHGTPVADVLPVEITGEEEKIDPSVGLAIIIDTSGSMGGTRIELAKQVARIAVRRLQPHDRIGIVEFYGAKHWAVPMQPASNKIEIDRAIGRMKAIGGTILYPAIQEAYYGLKNVNTRYKHILLITDAGVEDSNYERMVRRISKDNINVSTILVGQGGHNLIMSDIANWGQGRFYSVGDQFSLVELILKQPSTRKPPRYKRGFFEVTALGGQGWWGGTDPLVPELLGYSEVEARDGAETLLSAGQDPILASWHYGLGRVSALMTEPVGEGTGRWRDWPDYGSFLGRLLARTAADNPPFRLSLKRRRHLVELTAERTSHNTDLVPNAELVDAQGSSLPFPVPFKENAPGLFEATIVLPTEEAARVEVATGNGRPNQPVQRIALPPASDIAKETQVDPVKALDLGRLAERTGGVHLASVGGTPPSGPVGDWLAGNQGELSYVVTRLWPLLLLLALASYLGELLYRRWPRGARP
ncbi:MAG: VWA domain-containing protein [Gammaproteobacteria bacterium]|nr:VWA domain-containing protein [Gammaproteobacteria bacterium]